MQYPRPEFPDLYQTRVLPGHFVFRRPYRLPLVHRHNNRYHHQIQMHPPYAQPHHFALPRYYLAASVLFH